MVEAPLRDDEALEDAGASGGQRAHWGAAVATGVGMAVGLLGLYALSIALFADASVLRDADGGIVRLGRFNCTMIVLSAFICASLRHDGPATCDTLARLRSRVDAPRERWADWTRRAVARRPGRLALAAAAGTCFGLAVNAISSVLMPPRSPDLWQGHGLWAAFLTPFQFALLGCMADRSLSRARVLFEMGSHARVRLLDTGGLRPFASAGVRAAAFWLIGSSIASLLALDASVPGVVLGVLVITLGLGVSALLLPSRGLHQRIRAEKARELAWVREAIERARDELARGRGDPEASLPALLAYETRVQQVHEWPFDTPSLLRFALFLLVPLGSWLGGALVERAVDSALR
ncbi:MAG: hypothetical protein QNK03_04830 [Myxococcota bacterium]|nr:hypothetical protein [Myxococcota bacterium]